MFSGILSLAALVVGGIIVADIIANPAGTKAASSGVNTLVSGAEAGLLGKTS
jgi:hypothetical protein